MIVLKQLIHVYLLKAGSTLFNLYECLFLEKNTLWKLEI